MAYDLGYSDMGMYGQKLIQTPNLDRMARERLRFTQMYAGSTVCAPSRAVLMTAQSVDHEKLTYRFQGRDYRLTDVHGIVQEKLLA